VEWANVLRALFHETMKRHPGDHCGLEIIRNAKPDAEEQNIRE